MSGLMPEWEVLMVERECEVGEVSASDILDAMADALKCEGISSEEMRRIREASNQVSREAQSEFNRAIRDLRKASR